MKPVPTVENTVPRLRQMFERLQDGYARTEDAFWTQSAADIIEALDDSVCMLKGDLQEARRQICELKAEMHKNAVTPQQYAELCKWDCYREDPDAD